MGENALVFSYGRPMVSGRNMVCTLPEKSVVIGVPDLVNVRSVAFSRSKGPAIGLPEWEMTRPRENNASRLKTRLRTFSWSVTGSRKTKVSKFQRI